MTSPRWSVSAAFLVFGAIAGTLVPRLPTLKEQLHLSDGQVGIALLAYAVGAVTGAVLARLVLARGARMLVRVGTVGLCLLLIPPAFAPTFVWLVISFLVLGVAGGLLDVLENSQAAEIEREAKRPMINGFHGFWSLGAIAGSVAAAAAAHFDLAPSVHFTAAAIFLAGVSIPLTAGVPNTRGGAATILPSGTTRWQLGTAVGAVAAIACLGILVESGGADWSPIYLRDFGHADPGTAAIAFGAFSVAMTMVRFGADQLTARTSPGVVILFGGLLSAAGIGLAIAMPQPLVALTGFAVVGAGSAVMVPLAFSAGANLEKTGTALSLVMGAGYAGSIVGPFVIGSASDRFGLRVALWVPLLGALVIGAIAAASLRSLGGGAAERS